MKRGFLILFMVAYLATLPRKALAQDPISLIIKEGITKVIKAVDLKIQRLQTKTIWLQNAQKVIENTMSKLELDEITGWVEKQRVLYKDYFEELQKVKPVLTFYYKVKEITQLQLALTQQYKKSMDGIRKDLHFTPAEVNYMQAVYSGIIDESLKNLDGLSLAINPFSTQMSDEKRMEIIDAIKEGIQTNLEDIKAFSSQNIQLSLARAKDQRESSLVRTLYGLQ